MSLEINSVGDFASVLGVLIALLGFFLTIKNTMRSQRAAELAKEASNAVKDRLDGVKTIADLSTTIAIMEDIKRANRKKDWSALPERYSQLRRELISIRARHRNISSQNSRKISSAIQQLSISENQIEKVLFGKKDDASIDIPKHNKAISKQISELVEVITDIQQGIGMPGDV